MWQRRLAEVLQAIEQHDLDYAVRNPLIFEALHLAQKCGYAAGVRCDPGEPGWPVVYLELPTGQISWHVPEHVRAWDGHSTAKKYRRLQKWLRDLPPSDEPRYGRRFVLQRHVDTSGVSGTGLVAIGYEVQPEGKCVLYWLRSGRSIGIYDSLGALLEIHGHGDATVVEWLDER